MQIEKIVVNAPLGTKTKIKSELKPLGLTSIIEYTLRAINLYMWATSQVKNGLSIGSYDKNSQTFTVVTSPEFEKITNDLVAAEKNKNPEKTHVGRMNEPISV